MKAAFNRSHVLATGEASNESHPCDIYERWAHFGPHSHAAFFCMKVWRLHGSGHTVMEDFQDLATLSQSENKHVIRIVGEMPPSINNNTEASLPCLIPTDLNLSSWAPQLWDQRIGWDVTFPVSSRIEPQPTAELASWLFADWRIWLFGFDKIRSPTTNVRWGPPETRRWNLPKFQDETGPARSVSISKSG